MHSQAAGGPPAARGTLWPPSRAEYDEKLSRLVADGTVSAGEQLYIQEYVPGVLAYLQFFYSPLRGEAEFFGADQRHESDIEGLARMPAPVQMAAQPGGVPSFNVIGNTPIVLRESLLAEAYDMADRFVAASRRLVGPGMTGPFCIEGVYDGDGAFTAFEFSARIVAGTNIYMDGSPYYSLLHGEPISMGRRIAREIKDAAAAGRLDRGDHLGRRAAVAAAALPRLRRRCVRCGRRPALGPRGDTGSGRAPCPLS